MGLFSKKPEPQVEAVDLDAPFVFRVDNVFTITGKERMFTGTVESGTVAADALAAVVVGDSILLGQIKRLETRKRRKPVALSAGKKGSVELAGVETNDLPMRVYGGQMIVDTETLKGAVIRSRQPSDVPPNFAA